MSRQQKCISTLESLKMKGMALSLAEGLEVAEQENQSHLDFLNQLLEKEISYRTERRKKRNMAGAHFPLPKSLESFDLTQVEGIDEKTMNNLNEMTWIDRQENLLFLGPPGLGKTHLAIGLGIKAIEMGYKVCFERMSSLVKLLKTTEIQRSSAFRINRLMKSSLVIIDEIGYTPIDRKEANLFFNLVSSLYEQTSLIITSNKGFDDWAEMMGDEVLTTALLDRILHHAQIFPLSGESYRIKSNKED